ncbi:MAG: hypothetical protein GY861_22275 [bacterium]|nr:hypothetical protein [bacterium]
MEEIENIIGKTIKSYIINSNSQICIVFEDDTELTISAEGGYGYNGTLEIEFDNINEKENSSDFLSEYMSKLKNFYISRKKNFSL